MSSQGPLSPSTTLQLAFGGTVVWSGVGNVVASDNSYATAVLNNAEVSQALIALGFGFSIPSNATIAGILLEIERAGSSTLNLDSSVRLYKAGSPAGSDKASGSAWPSSDAYASYGGPTDLWGTTWTPTEINDSANFGAHLQATSTAASQTASVDHMRITVYYDVLVPSKPWALSRRVTTTMGSSDFIS